MLFFLFNNISRKRQTRRIEKSVVKKLIHQFKPFQFVFITKTPISFFRFSQMLFSLLRATVWLGCSTFDAASSILPVDIRKRWRWNKIKRFYIFVDTIKFSTLYWKCSFTELLHLSSVCSPSRNKYSVWSSDKVFKIKSYFREL